MKENEYILKLSRLEICDIMLACTSIKLSARDEMLNDPDCPEYRRDVVLPGTIKKWEALHDNIERQLNGNDANCIFSELLEQYDDGKLSKEELQAEMGRRIGFLL